MSLFGRQLPVIIQSDASECGLACVAMIAAYYGNAKSLTTIRNEFSVSLRGTTLTDLTFVADKLGLESRAVKVELSELSQLNLPCVLHWNFNHFVVLRKIRRNGVVLHDPGVGIREIPLEEVSNMFTGIALELEPAVSFVPAHRSAGLPWYRHFDWVRGLPVSLFQVFALTLALQCLVLFAPFYTQWVVDNAIVTADFDLLALLAIGFGMVTICQAAIGWMRSWVVLHLGTQLQVHATAGIFRHLVSLPMSFFERRNVGDITSRLSSIQTIQQTFSTSFVEAIIDGLLAVTTLVVMLIYSRGLTLIVSTSVVIYAVLRVAAFGPLRERRERALVAGARQQAYLLETLRAVLPVKLFGKELGRSGTFLNLATDTANATIRADRLQMAYQACNVALFGTASVLTVYFGAGEVIAGALTVGMLLAFTTYSTMFATRLSALVDKLVEFRILSLHADRVADIALAAPEDHSGPPPRLGQSSAVTNTVKDSPIIAAKDLAARYSDADPMLFASCSFEVGPRETVAIIGPSGAGKTTLLKVLLGVVPPARGEVWIGGKTVREVGLAQFRAMVGTVMQDDQLLSGTIAENISFFSERPDFVEIERCAQLAAIHDDILRLPMGYHTLVVGDMGSVVSGGQKQRILLARALYKQPAILFLDEATSHLDLENERAVIDGLRELPMAKIIVAHRPATIASADRRILLTRDGVLVDVR